MATTINNDGVWSWFADPRAVYDSGSDTTYYGFVDSTGNVIVAAIDHTAGTMRARILRFALAVDDHANPTIRVRSDGKIQAFYSRHSDGQVLHRTSTNASDITEWDAEQSIGSSTDVTYPTPIDLTGKLVLHWREGTSSPRPQKYAESTDDGATFGTIVSLFSESGETPYLKCAKHPSSDRIDYAVTNGHPNETTTSVYHFYRDASGDFRASDGTLLSSGTASLPLAPADVTQVWDGASDGDAWIWEISHDSSNNPVILISKVPDDTNHEMHYAKFSGGSWSVNKIDDVGGKIQDGAAEDQYSAGGSLDPDDDTRCFIAIESSGTSEIYQYDTADGGSSWTQGTQLTSLGAETARPYVPRNRKAGLFLLAFSGTYTSALDYDTSILGFGADAPAIGSPQTGSVTQNDSGLVASDDFDRADSSSLGTGWTKAQGTDAEILSNQLVLTASDSGDRDASSIIVLRDDISRGEVFVQCHMRCPGTGQGRIAVRWEGTYTGGDGSGYWLESQPADEVRVREVTNYSITTLDSDTAFGFVSSQFVPYQFYVADGVQQCHFTNTAPDSGSFSEADTTHDGENDRTCGFVARAFGADGVMEVDDWLACKTKTLTVDGLASGQKVQVLNTAGEIVAELFEDGGSVAIDLTQNTGGVPEDVPFDGWAKLIITDGGETQLGDYNASGVYPGSAYTSSVTAGPTPTTNTIGVQFSAFVKDESPPPKTTAIGVSFNAFVREAGEGDDEIKRFSGRHIGKAPPAP